MFENFWPIMGKVLKTEWRSILEGLGTTLLITFSAMLIGLVIGTLIASVKVLPKKKTNYVLRALEKIGDVYVWFFRGTPMVVQLLLFYFVLLADICLQLGIDSPTVVAIVVFGLNSGAYVSEMMRGGILSVDKGQLEASRSLGLSYSRSMSKVVLPQALKNAIPSLGNEFITLFKETSVAGFIAVIDITKAMQLIVASTYNVAVPYILLTVIYLLFVTLFAYILRLIERRLRKGDLRK